MSKPIGRFMLLFVVFCLLTFCSCGKSDLPVNAVPADDSAAQSRQSEGGSYSTSTEDLLGTWTVAFYSDDNVSYSAYNGEGTDDGTFTFYADGLAVIALDGGISTYHFDISEEKGTLAFSDIDSGQAMDFYFGYGVLHGEKNDRLVITRYNVSDHSVRYYILTTKTWL